MNRIKKVYIKTENAILIFLLVSIGIVLFAQVISRYFLQKPLLWTEELARYLQVWITFLGVGFGLRYQSYVAMTLLFKNFSQSIQYSVEIIINIILLICFIVILPTAHSFTAYQNSMLSSTLRIPMSYIVVVIPISIYLLIAYAIKNIILKIYLLYKQTKRED